ncbi:MAG: hypothetical protein Q7J34_00385 [Bacteroidales bacterium]|jgi:hypothetical protein|nr:hypothetical protein [Bacteroidales bacterium]
MSNPRKTLPKYSSHLFWDINPNELELELHKQFIVQRVLQYGLMDDWKLLIQSIEIKEIAEIAIQIKDLDKRTGSFISALSEIPKEEFRCYSIQQSIPPHWNF